MNCLRQYEELGPNTACGQMLIRTNHRCNYPFNLMLAAECVISIVTYIPSASYSNDYSVTATEKKREKDFKRVSNVKRPSQRLRSLIS